MPRKFKIKLLPLILAALFCFCSCQGGSAPRNDTPITTGDAVAPGSAGFSHLEINQALSYGIDSKTGAFYPMDTFVCGKTTAVFARFDVTLTAKEAAGYTVALVGADDEGNDVSGLPVSGELLSDGTSICFTLPADMIKSGSYEVRLSAAGFQTSVNAVFTETRTLRLLLVPIKGCYGGDVTEPEDGWQNGAEHLISCYPIAEDNVTVVTGDELDLSDVKYDLYTTDGQYAVWYELSTLQDSAEVKYDLILGFVNGMMGEAQNIGGYTYGLPANIINAGLPCSQAIVSHEVAHCFLVGDEYEGGAFNLSVNEAPLGYTGKFWYSRSETVTGDNKYVPEAYSLNLCCSGSAVMAEQIPYDARTHRQMGNAASIMCGCDEEQDKYWITSEIWEQLYYAFTLREYAVETGFKGGVLQNSDGELELYCENCLHDYPLSQVEYYGYCQFCFSMTRIDPSQEKVSFDCASCGTHNEDTAIYLRCPYEYCHEYLRVEPFAGGDGGEESEPIAYGSKSVGTLDLAADPYVDVLFVRGLLHKGEGGDTFELIELKPGTAHIDTVDMRDVGSCALLITDSEGVVRSSLYFTPDYLLTGEPPFEVDMVYVSFTVRMPKDAAEISFYHTVPGNGETEGYMESGGWKARLTGLS